MLGVSKYSSSTQRAAEQTPCFDPDFPEFLSGVNGNGTDASRSSPYRDTCLTSGLFRSSVNSHLVKPKSPFSMNLFSPCPGITNLAQEHTNKAGQQHILTPPAFNTGHSADITEPDTTFKTPPAKPTDQSGDQTKGESPATSPEVTDAPTGSSKSRTATKRTIFTQVQLATLERRFVQQTFLSREERQELAESLSISERQVMVWFQNRRGRLKKRGPADMAYNPMKLNELNNRRPYPFLYGMLSSMHYQSSPHSQVWSVYPDDIRTVATSVIDDRQTTKCGGKMPSSLSNRTTSQRINGSVLDEPCDTNGMLPPPNIAMTLRDVCSSSLQADNVSPAGSPRDNTIPSTLPHSVEPRSPGDVPSCSYGQHYGEIQTQTKYTDIAKYQPNYYTGTGPSNYNDLSSNQSSVRDNDNTNHDTLPSSINDIHSNNNSVYMNQNNVFYKGYHNSYYGYQTDTYCAPAQTVTHRTYGLPYNQSQIAVANPYSTMSHLPVPSSYWGS